MAPASWTWFLCDASGANLAELTTASGKTLTYTRNTYAEAACVISHEDDAAALVLNAVANTGMPTLQGYRKGPNDTAGMLQFNGVLAPFTEACEETSLLSLVFRSPFSVLLGDGSGRGRFAPPPPAAALSYTTQDAGAIAKSLIDTANTDGFTGLATTGAIATTKTRTRAYPVGTNLGQAVIDLTNVLDGFDFTETFVAGGTTLAQFGVVAAIGVDNPASRFEYGPGTLANCRNMGRTTEPPANSILVIGGNGLTSTYSDAASVAKYGKWYAKAEYVDVTEQVTLDDKAKALCRPNPVKTLTLTPELGVDSCPKPFDDWDLGDTVRLFARRSALSENASVRLNAFTIAISDDGFETAAIQDPTTPEQDAVISANLAVEVVG